MAIRTGRDFLDRLCPRVWQLDGEERATGQPLRILFAGQLENKRYVARLAYGGTFAEADVGRVWTWRAWRRGVRANVDLVVLQTDREHWEHFLGRCGFFIPSWVGLRADLDVALERCKTSGSVKRELQRIRSQRLQCEVTRQPDRFADFYHTMYVPHLRRVYGDGAMPTTWDELAGDLEHSDLFLIKKGAEHIGGKVISYVEGRAQARIIGVRDGEPTHVKAGAMAAAYYFSIRHLAEKGYKSIDYGGTRPFLHDGVLQFKKKWGARVVDAVNVGFVVMRARGSAGAGAFFANNPCIVEHNGRFCAAIFQETFATNEDEWGGLEEDCRELGLAAVRYYTFLKGTGLSETPVLIREKVLEERSDVQRVYRECVAENPE